THLFWLAPSLSRLQREFTSSYNESTRELLCRSTRFQFRQSTPITQIALVQKSHYEHNGQDCRTERDSRPGPEECLCAIRHRHGTGKPRRSGCSAKGIRCPDRAES